MSDALIREVQEDLRRDRAVALAKRYGGYVVLLALAIIVGTAGYVGWRSWQTSVRAAESEKLFAALRELDSGKPAPALSALQEVAGETSAGVAAIARFQAAEAAGQEKDRGQAEKILAEVGAGSVDDAILKEAARIGVLSRQLDTADPADLIAQLQPLTAADDPFRHSARELLGLAKLRAGDREGAKATFDDALKDPSIPFSAHARLTEYRAALETGT